MKDLWGDMVLTKLVSSLVNVPIASGGAGTVQHLKEVIAKGGASMLRLVAYLYI
jgi:imidazole glycerol phosphate synthase subunit HisF